MLLDDLILTETLFTHLWKIDEIAHCRMERLTEELLERNPAPDKATRQFAWIQHMNMLKAQAEEIIVAELIYSYPPGIIGVGNSESQKSNSQNEKRKNTQVAVQLHAILQQGFRR